MQSFIHYSLHLLVPLPFAWLLARKNWKRAYLILLAIMLVDLDHLLADPVFQANRCSIHFHLLHRYEMFPIYLGMLFFKPPIRWIGLGLAWHMVTDLVDCTMTFSSCAACLVGAPAE
ncbi:MAG: DUF6122 family protein, partial [Bacteroidota bacterium]